MSVKRQEIRRKERAENKITNTLPATPNLVSRLQERRMKEEMRKLTGGLSMKDYLEKVASEEQPAVEGE